MSIFDKIHTGVLSCLETRITQNPKWLKFKKPNIQVTIKLRGAGIQEAENSNRNTLFLCYGDQMTIIILFIIVTWQNSFYTMLPGIQWTLKNTKKRNC